MTPFLQRLTDKLGTEKERRLNQFRSAGLAWYGVKCYVRRGCGIILRHWNPEWQLIHTSQATSYVNKYN